MSHDPPIPSTPTRPGAWDAETLATQIDRYAGLVYATCLRICGNASDADDATQDTFLALAAQAASIRTSLPAWLHTVATRTAQRLCGRRPRARPLPLAEPAVPASHEAWQQLLPQLDAAIDRLPPALRELVVLRYLQGLDQRAIAAAVGSSQPTVSRRLEEALRRLREDLQHADPAVALLACAAHPALLTAAMRAGWRRIALLRRPTPAGWLTRRGFLQAAGVLALAPLGVLLTTRPGEGSAPADAAPPAPVPAPAVPCLARPITLTWHGRFDRAIGFLAEQLQPAQGDRLELLASASQAEATVLVEIAVEAVPLHAVLEQLCTQAGWRWRAAGSTILLDRPLPAPARAAAMAALEQACATGTPAAIAAAAAHLTTSGDASAGLAAVTMLGDASLDALAARDADRAAVVQGALLQGITALHTDLRPWAATSAWHRMRAGRPWAAIAACADASPAPALARCWARCRAHPELPITPLLCVLLGDGHVPGVAADLRALVTAPATIVPRLDPTHPVLHRALLRVQAAAILALGILGERAAIPELLAELTRAPHGPLSDACITALTLLHEPRVVPLLLDRPLPDSEVAQGCEYTALATLAPEALEPRLRSAWVARAAVDPVDGGTRWRVRQPTNLWGGPGTVGVVATAAAGDLLAARAPAQGAWIPVTQPATAQPLIPLGWWDAFTTRPVAALLPRLLAISQPQLAPSRVREALRQGCQRLGPAALPALQATDAPGVDPAVRAWGLLLRTRLGEPHALAALLATLPAQIDAVPWSWGAEAGLPALTAATLARLVQALAPVAGPTTASGTTLAWLAVAGAAPVHASLAALPTLPAPQQPGVVSWLAQSGDPAVDQELARLLREDLRLRHAVDALPHTWLDPHLGQALATALPQLPLPLALQVAVRLWWAEADAVSLATMLAWFEGLDPATVPVPGHGRSDLPFLPRSMEFAPPLAADAIALQSRLARVFLRWASPGSPTALRQEAMAWIAAFAAELPAGILAEVLAALPGIEVDADPQLRRLASQVRIVAGSLATAPAMAGVDAGEWTLAGTWDPGPALAQLDQRLPRAAEDVPNAPGQRAPAANF